LQRIDSGITGLISSSMIASRISAWLMSGECCVEMTTVSTACGRPSA